MRSLKNFHALTGSTTTVPSRSIHHTTTL